MTETTDFADWRGELCRVRHALQRVLTWAACHEPPLASPCLDDAQDVLNREDVKNA
jgi:hypothetical protein